MPGEGSAAALPDRPGTGGGPEEVSGRPADRGATGGDRGPALDVVPPQPLAGRAGGVAGAGAGRSGRSTSTAFALLARAEADRADRQRQRAETREQMAIDAVKRFRDAVAENDELKNSPELEGLRKTLLKEPLAFFRSLRDQLQADADTRPASLARLADASSELGRLTDEIGDKQDAIIAHREALAIRQRLADAHPIVFRYQRDLATSHNDLGKLLAITGERAVARASYGAALAIRERLVEAHPEVAAYQRDLAQSRHNLGNLLASAGEWSAARASYEAALSIRAAAGRGLP